MAERRIFSIKVTESDAFFALPANAQALYLHLNMLADDDGFIKLNWNGSEQLLTGQSGTEIRTKNLFVKNWLSVLRIRSWTGLKSRGWKAVTLLTRSQSPIALNVGLHLITLVLRS